MGSMLRRILLEDEDDEDEEEDDSVSLTCPPRDPAAAATAENGRPLRYLGRWACIMDLEASMLGLVSVYDSMSQLED